jgi:tRNA threonylcarbamoyladenosine biosynthesis protein TsaE
MEYTCTAPEELDGIAESMLRQHPNARVFALYGKMGSGKTTFIKSICMKLNVADIAISPSFGIINEYATIDDNMIYHFDFYRIKSLMEFLDLGCEEYLYSGNYCFIEWPEKITDFLPVDFVPVFIEEVGAQRFIKF